MNALNIKTLRKQTGAGFLDCKRALEESQDNLEKAVLWLRKKGLSDAVKKFGREASNGIIFSYIHGMDGKLAVMVEANCETDFVARTDQFKEFVKNIALHIAASNPLYINEKEVPETEKQKELEVIRAKIEKPTTTKELNKKNDHKLRKKKSEDDLLNEWVASVTLLKQKYVKNLSLSVEDYLKEIIAKTGENVIIRRFIRWKLGEEE